MIEFLLFDLLGDPTYRLVGIALAFVVSLIAISYMAGEFFNMPSLKGFAKLELSDLAVTSAIIIIAVALAMKGGVFDLMSQGFMVPDPNQNMTCAGSSLNYTPAFAQAEYFLGCNPKVQIVTPSPSSPSPINVTYAGVLGPRLATAYGSLMVNEMFIGLLSGFSTNLEIYIPEIASKVNIGMVPFIAMGPLNEVHTVLVDAVGVAYGAVAAQKMLLVFIYESALPFFLPFGLLLRAFPFSRKTGSTVLAVVFAAYFIYPTSILINEQIWVMIVNPQPDPGSSCKTNGYACGANSECCSLNCGGPAGAMTCLTPLTDFQDYTSVFGVCLSHPGITSDQINASLNNDATSYDQRMTQTYFSPQDINAYPNASTKSEARIYDGWAEINRKIGLVTGTGSGLVWPTPQHAIENTFTTIDKLVSDAMQFTILTMLFLVIEIIITMTLMKDFAMLIGGEPRVFGMSRLV